MGKNVVRSGILLVQCMQYLLCPACGQVTPARHREGGREGGRVGRGLPRLACFVCGGCTVAAYYPLPLCPARTGSTQHTVLAPVVDPVLSQTWPLFQRRFRTGSGKEPGNGGMGGIGGENRGLGTRVRTRGRGRERGQEGAGGGAHSRLRSAGAPLPRRCSTASSCTRTTPSTTNSAWPSSIKGRGRSACGAPTPSCSPSRTTARRRWTSSCPPARRCCTRPVCTARPSTCSPSRRSSWPCTAATPR